MTGKPEFEFSVYVGPREIQTGGVKDVYTVSLPHQCDDWTVAYGEKAEAVAQLRQFIREAEESLQRLESLEPCPHEWQDDGDESVNNGGTHRWFRCNRCDQRITQVIDRSTAQPWYAERYFDPTGEDYEPPREPLLTA